MRLTPRDIDKLTLHGAGFLAQKRLARGLRLNHPEAIALIATQIMELIRDGRSVAELMDLGRRILGRSEVMEGVPELVPEVQVEGTFPDGTKLVTVHTPIALEHGDLDLALYGSFLPVPSRERFRAAETVDPEEPGARKPGEVLVRPGEIVLNAGRREATMSVENRGDRPIQVGSHYPFAETNRALVFDRALAAGMRLDIPAGAAVRFEPGESKTVRLVAVHDAGAALRFHPTERESERPAGATVISATATVGVEIGTTATATAESGATASAGAESAMESAGEGEAR